MQATPVDMPAKHSKESSSIASLPRHEWPPTRLAIAYPLRAQLTHGAASNVARLDLVCRDLDRDIQLQPTRDSAHRHIDHGTLVSALVTITITP